MGVVYKQTLAKNKIDSPTLKLSASVGTDSFFYVIENAHSNQLIDIQAYHTEQPLAMFADSLNFVGDFMAQNPILFDPFDEIVFGISNVPHRLVSSKQLDESNPKDLLSEVSLVAAEDHIQVQSIPGLGAHSLFAFPKHLKEEIELYFENVQYVHTHASILNYLANAESWSLNDRAFHFDFSGKSVNLSAWRFGKLQLFQQWPANSAMDIRYYLTAALNKLAWETNEFQHYFSGSRIDELENDPFFQPLIDQNETVLNFGNWPTETNHLMSLYAISKCAS